jgi:hypothetical protein
MTQHIVMAGLVPAIHVLVCSKLSKTWMPATSAAMTERLGAIVLTQETG